MSLIQEEIDSDDLDWEEYFESCEFCEDNQVPTLDGPVCSVCNNPIQVYTPPSL